MYVGLLRKVGWHDEFGRTEGRWLMGTPFPCLSSFSSASQVVLDWFWTWFWQVLGRRKPRFWFDTPVFAGFSPVLELSRRRTAEFQFSISRTQRFRATTVDGVSTNGAPTSSPGPESCMFISPYLPQDSKILWILALTLKVRLRGCKNPARKPLPKTDSKTTRQN